MEKPQLHRIRSARGVVPQKSLATFADGGLVRAAYVSGRRRSRHPIEGFTESLRCELLHDNSGVRVTMVQLPALNTPHFSVVRSRLPRHPKPVPPIFEPEVAAEAVLWAAEHPTREVVVGFSTLRALLANKIAPGLVDRFLARSGYDSQQTEQPVPPDRPDNLWKTLPGDRGAHGTFGGAARRRSVRFAATTHRRLATAAGLAGLATVGLWRRRRASD